MIIVKLKGGLGNQMFQAATGYALAKYHNTELKLDLSFLLKNNISNEYFTARKYELDGFNYNFNIATEKEVNLFLRKQSTVWGRLKQKMLRPTIIIENFQEYILLENSSKNSYLDGYWQNENYFKNYRVDILKMFTFKELPDQFKEVKKEILNTNSVSIHFRRGDYISNKNINQFHGTCSLEYYQNAISYIQSKIANIKLFIFSDEMDWVKKNIIVNIECKYIQTCDIFWDMFLMSSCKHHIIANSSFSWWGAWLANWDKQIVVAPKKWFNVNGINTQDLIPEKWIQI